METKIIIVILDTEELDVFYVLNDITTEELKDFVEKVTEHEVSDIFEEKQENLQYYCIDGRVWIDTIDKAIIMRAKIKLDKLI